MQMPLYIRDDAVDDLAEKVMKVTGAKTKTDAVRKALQAQLDAELSRKPLLERLQPVLQQARQIGERDPNFDMKKYTDEMWDNM
jgi:antitoxin VapB